MKFTSLIVVMVVLGFTQSGLAASIQKKLNLKLAHHVACKTQEALLDEPIVLEYTEFDDGHVEGTGRFLEMEACGSKYWIRVNLTRSPAEDYVFEVHQAKTYLGHQGIIVAQTRCETANLDQMRTCWVKRSDVNPLDLEYLITEFALRAQ